MIAPTIHMNGTGREALLDQVTDAASALYKALDALSEAAPNGRDYYPQGPAAFEQARTEHQSRADRLRSVLSELQALAETIADA